MVNYWGSAWGTNWGAYSANFGVVPVSPEENRTKLSFIDLRKTIEELNHTSGWVWCAIRVADRTKKCQCVQTSEQGYQMADPNCRRCFKTGYKFTDHVVRAFHWAFGFGMVDRLTTHMQNAVVQWNRPLTTSDYFMTLALDPETGEPTVPYRVTRTFAITDTRQLIDKNNLSYWRIYVEDRLANRGQAGEVGLPGYSSQNKNMP
jgi:hypothetical protein